MNICLHVHNTQLQVVYGILAAHPWTSRLRTPVLVSLKSLFELLGILCISYFWQICFTRIVWCETIDRYGACGARGLCALSGLSRGTRGCWPWQIAVSGRTHRRDFSQLLVPEGD